jgi:hypothetical protein
MTYTDPGGSKTYGSGSGSTTLLSTNYPSWVTLVDSRESQLPITRLLEDFENISNKRNAVCSSRSTHSSFKQKKTQGRKSRDTEQSAKSHTVNKEREIYNDVCKEQRPPYTVYAAERTLRKLRKFVAKCARTLPLGSRTVPMQAEDQCRRVLPHSPPHSPLTPSLPHSPLPPTLPYCLIMHCRQVPARFFRPILP